MYRKLKIETVVRIPLQAYAGKNPRHQRYQLRRRGKIAQLLKPKRRMSAVTRESATNEALEQKMRRLRRAEAGRKAANRLGTASSAVRRLLESLVGRQQRRIGIADFAAQRGNSNNAIR